MTAGATTVGRPKTGQKPERPADENGRVAIIHLKGSREYAEWLDALHAKTRIPKATMIREAIAAYAKALKFKAPPEL